MYFRNEENIVQVVEHRTRTESLTSVKSVGSCSTIPAVNIIVTLLLPSLLSDYVKLHVC